MEGSRNSTWEEMVGVLWQVWNYLIGMGSSSEGARIILLLLLVIICLLLLLLLLSCLLCWQCRRRRSSRSRKLERQDSASTTVTLETSSPNSWESWSIESKEGGFTKEPHTWTHKEREEGVFVEAAQSWINQSMEEGGFTQDWEARRIMTSQGAIREARVGGKEDDFIQVLENMGNKRPIFGKFF